MTDIRTISLGYPTATAELVTCDSGDFILSAPREELLRYLTALASGTTDRRAGARQRRSESSDDSLEIYLARLSHHSDAEGFRHWLESPYQQRPVFSIGSCLDGWSFYARESVVQMVITGRGYVFDLKNGVYLDRIEAGNWMKLKGEYGLHGGRIIRTTEGAEIMKRPSWIS